MMQNCKGKDKPPVVLSKSTAGGLSKHSRTFDITQYFKPEVAIPFIKFFPFAASEVLNVSGRLS